MLSALKNRGLNRGDTTEPPFCGGAYTCCAVAVLYVLVWDS